MRSNLPRILTATFLLFLTLLFIIGTPISQAATASHVVISEISLSGFTTSDEFVELYNPTDQDINLQNWRLRKKTDSGAESNLVASLSGVIKSHGYFLIVPQTGYMGLVPGDRTFSVAGAQLAQDNTVLLYSDAGITLVDKVGFGAVVDREGTAAANPIVGEGLERKANSNSTVESMVEGVDKFLGNGEDTDNNSSDFIKRVVSNPQNANSALEPVATPTPTTTSTPTVTVTPTPTETITPTPTETTTPTPTPTLTETQTPTITETPTPSPMVTPTPTATPSPTVLPTATPTATVTPTVTVTPTPTVSPFPRFNVVCTTRMMNFHIFNVTFSVPLVSCNLVRL